MRTACVAVVAVRVAAVFGSMHRQPGDAPASAPPRTGATAPQPQLRRAPLQPRPMRPVPHHRCGPRRLRPLPPRRHRRHHVPAPAAGAPRHRLRASGTRPGDAQPGRRQLAARTAEPRRPTNAPVLCQGWPSISWPSRPSPPRPRVQFDRSHAGRPGRTASRQRTVGCRSGLLWHRPQRRRRRRPA